MKQTLEEAARAFAEKCRMANIKAGLDYPYDEIDMRNAFEEGAEWQVKQSPWISVEDAIPNKQAKGMCQVKFVDGSIDEMAMREVNKWIYPYIKTGYVTHWMPIPSFDEIFEANKDVLERIKEKAAWLKQIYEAPNPEVDKIVAELKEDAKLMPKNITKDEEIAWILKEANGEDDFEKLQAIISEDVTVQTEKLKESIVAHFQEACGASYSFRDILDNLDDDAIQEEIIKWARCNFLRLQIIGEKGEMQ